MRITDLSITDYKILKNFKIEKNEEPVSVFIGINGSGKSSLLEALAIIFSQSYQYHVEGKTSIKPFSDFNITYHIWPTTITEEDAISQETITTYLIVNITCDEKRKQKFELRIQGELIKSKKSEDYRTTMLGILPSSVIIYYAGLNATMQNLCRIHEKSFSQQLQENNVEGVRPLFYFKPEHYKLLLLSLLSFEYGDIPIYLKEHLNIEDLSSFSINIKKPSWGKGNSSDFWGAEGAVKTFLEFCKEFAKRVTISEDDSAISFQFLGLQPLYYMKDFYGEERKFFQILDIALFDDLLDSVDINLIKDSVEIKAENLSEGEQQFITIKALNELLITPFTLLLFDEPDTFLHPQLQTKFISELIEYSNYACYYITTHSSILISNLKKGNLYAMRKGEIKQIQGHFFGREYSNNLEDLMNTPSRNIESQNKLDSIFKLIDDENFKLAKSAINEFEKEYGFEDPEILRANSLIDFLEN